MGIKAAIEALAHNATHPKFIIEALHEIEARLSALEAHAKPAEAEATAPEPAPETPAAPAVPPVTA